MSDRELLEAAAKAAGIKIIEWSPDGTMPYIKMDRHCAPSWTPLDDDGDALRLAVKLKLELHHHSDDGAWFVNVGPPTLIGPFEILEHGCDEFAATRRAIVRAAAEIGRSK